MTSVFIFCDDQLILDFLFQLRYMRNNSDQPWTFRHFLKYTNRLISGMFIKWTKALIDKHHIKIDCRRTLLDLICHAKRKGQCRHKGFSAGKCTYFTLFSCHRGIHHQIKTSVFSLTGFFEIIHPQFKLSRRHFLKASVCRIKNPLQIISLYKSFQIHSRTTDIARSHAVQRIDPCMFLYNCFALLHPRR